VSHIHVLICRVDDPASDQMTAPAAFDLPETDLTTLKPETALDDLETTTHITGNAILQRALQAQWDVIDDQLTVQHRPCIQTSRPSSPKAFPALACIHAA
jgi:hypothetical protein